MEVVKQAFPHVFVRVSLCALVPEEPVKQELADPWPEPVLEAGMLPLNVCR